MKAFHPHNVLSPAPKISRTFRHCQGFGAGRENARPMMFNRTIQSRKYSAALQPQ